MLEDENLCFAARRSPGWLIRRAAQLVVPRAESVFTNHHLTLSQWISLRLIREDVVETSAGLARQLGYNSGAVTRLIDQLEERGLLKRERSTDDRRVVNLELTNAGIAAVHEMTPKMNAFMRDTLRDFSAEETEALITLLAKLIDRLEATD
jgi:DNA-binding MarR family transcriptional regulator